MLVRTQHIEVSHGAFTRFAEALDAPVEDMPTLRRYARTRSRIPRASSAGDAHRRDPVPVSR
jgi:uncharacterized protein (DUF1778 family)